MIPRSYTFFASKNDLHLNGDKYFEKTSEVISLLNSKYGESRTVRLTLPEISLDNSEDFDSDISILSKCYQKALDLNFRWINQPFTISSRALVELVTVVEPPSLVETTDDEDSIFTSSLNLAALKLKPSKSTD